MIFSDFFEDCYFLKKRLCSVELIVALNNHIFYDTQLELKLTSKYILS
jgi:hypothetical protein